MGDYMKVPIWLKKIVAWILRQKEVQEFVDNKLEGVIEDKTGHKVDLPTDKILDKVADKIDE